MPYGERSAADVRQVHQERINSPPSGLDPALCWHLPGLLYLLTGLDRSLFELYAMHAGRSIIVPTYQAADPIIDVPGIDQSRWTGVVQGIAPDDHAQFVEHALSYAFRGQHTEWSLRLVSVRIADPFRRTCWPMVATLWLPQSAATTTRVARPGGLTLARPRIAVDTHSVEPERART